MNQILAYSDAEEFGRLVGMLLSLGILMFSIVAIVKAFTRRTVGWIIAGSIGGIIWGGIFLIFLAGFVSSVTSAHRRVAERTVEYKQQSALKPTVAVSPTSPSPPQIVHGQDMPYTLSLPSGWTVKHKEMDYDSLAVYKYLYIGVMAAEANVGAPEAVADAARQQFRGHVTDLSWSDPLPVIIDGRRWLEFTAKGYAGRVPVAYQFCVYAGSEGTYEIIGWTAQNLFDRDGEILRNVMHTFQFPR